jgi:hypothetical protein
LLKQSDDFERKTKGTQRVGNGWFGEGVEAVEDKEME